MDSEFRPWQLLSECRFSFPTKTKKEQCDLEKSPTHFLIGTHPRVLGGLALLSRENGQNQSHKQTTAGAGASGLGLLCIKRFPWHRWSLGLKMEERICECVWDCGVRSWGWEW